jgi:quinoprotein dehydrogenase-associated probable ABC transporter substrate-binding protein/PQQ-dependent catabolism-associated CXXCW motif protein
MKSVWPVDGAMKRVAVFVLGIALSAPSAAAQSTGLGAAGELVDPETLRVCADPNSMPFTNQALEGFENKIAELMAEKLERKRVTYTWFPMATGFVRRTLGDKRCDVIIGYPQGDELVQNTNHYYATAYALVFKPGAGLDGIETLEDPRLKGKRIGVIAGTPPATNIAINGLMGKAKPYQLMIDTRIANSSEQMIGDIVKDEIDVGVLWGPQAGWFAREAGVPLTVAPLWKEKTGARMVYRITMGVRATDQQWKRQLNTFIRRNQDEIDRILAGYGVPLLNDSGQPKPVAVKLEEPPPEPDGYRMDGYLGVTPLTLKGARVLTTDEAEAQWKAKSAVFVDVLPKLPKPKDLPEGTVWHDKPRSDIPGSVWLPDVGYGELAPEMDEYFRKGLADATGGDSSKTVVIYCKADCWMSWNAAKRALAYGYKSVAWYRDGTDGWAGKGLPLEERKSVPRPGETP